MRRSFDELAFGEDSDVDVVVDDVVVAKLVFVIRRAALRQHRGRRIEGNRAPPGAIEKRDVLGVVAAARVRQRAELVRADLRQDVPHLREDVPRFAAQIPEVDVE